MNNLPSMTPEQRLVAQEKSQESRQAKRLFAEENLILDFEDEAHWLSLAQKHDVRLPGHYEVGPKGLKRMCKKLKVDLNEYVESTGYRTVKQLFDDNPKWGTRPMTGVFLEWVEEKDHEFA